MEDWEDNCYWAKYSYIRVDPESVNYILTVTGFDGSASTVGDCMSYHNGLPLWCARWRRCHVADGHPSASTLLV